MRIFYVTVLFILISPGYCLSQDGSDAIYIDKPPTTGILLDNGWKFQTADDPAFASTGYDDKTWQSIDPTLDIYQLPPIAKKGICWLRLHLQLDSNVLNQQLALIINQAVASEIYLNGRLIYRFGKISTNPKEILAYDPLGKPVSFPLDKNPQQVLAIRYALQPGVWYTNIWNRTNPIARIRINEINTAFDEYRYERGMATTIIFRMGIFLILAILHLAFYLYYPVQKANLYLCLFALFGLAGLFQMNLPNEVKSIFYFSNLTLTLAGFQAFFLLTAIYSLFGQKRGWIYWGLFTGVITGVFLNGWGYPSPWMIVTSIIINVFNIEIVRIAFKSLKLAKRGAWIITTGAISFLVFYVAFQIGVIFHIWTHISTNYTIADLLFTIAALSMPVAISIYLGLDFAFTSYALKQKLTEVEHLSKKAIAHEKEKQQLLASQNDVLEKQVEERTSELSRSLKELKETQSQLVQREKMASLGELTAGIAHEIQNPLNFVNNFSEVNKELADELKSELAVGNLQSASEIANNIKDNSEKINNHGKRADDIVKGMLQHSRATSGQKEPTDINALADEYLRLAYHGLRAKDNLFNANFQTHFDNSIGKINIIPQDIGRVILNLLNNAFYAVNERQKHGLHGRPSVRAGTDGDDSAGQAVGRGYEPTVTLTTAKQNGNVELRVKDNGNGIPQKALGKIFQPFFTTKPTGQGTGLGLSLSYDIIKAHDGEIKVVSTEGEGSEFLIQIPTKKS